MGNISETQDLGGLSNGTFQAGRGWGMRLPSAAACAVVFALALSAPARSDSSAEVMPAPAEKSAAERAASVAAPSVANASPAAFALTSPAFEAGGNIPAEFSCQGADASPALSWADPPSKTQSFALVVDDPDAPSGTWVHWVAYDLPATLHSLPEGVPKQENVPGGGIQGENDFQKIGYGGPCPPPGKPHRYFFKLYALDAPLKLKPRATKEQVMEALKPHLLGESQLMGTFAR